MNKGLAIADEFHVMANGHAVTCTTLPELPPEEAEGDGIRDLTEQSLARMMRVTPELAQVLDTARSCAGATSLTVKRALLFQAMERDLRIVLPADKTVQAKDVAELARLVQTCKKAPDPQS